ncbi:hypothetical protein PUN28_007754 [Cardiocondyla obscurior]|uniref:Uncharacterized protein n=1 Tax=Cardiocondyla obscurior TaxID=286306 RepID=A0AAW2FW91_9HYME
MEKWSSCEIAHGYGNYENRFNGIEEKERERRRRKRKKKERKKIAVKKKKLMSVLQNNPNITSSLNLIPNSKADVLY